MTKKGRPLCFWAKEGMPQLKCKMRNYVLRCITQSSFSVQNACSYFLFVYRLYPVSSFTPALGGQRHLSCLQVTPKLFSYNFWCHLPSGQSSPEPSRRLAHLKCLQSLVEIGSKTSCPVPKFEFELESMNCLSRCALEVNRYEHHLSPDTHIQIWSWVCGLTLMTKCRKQDASITSPDTKIRL